MPQNTDREIASPKRSSRELDRSARRQSTPLRTIYRFSPFLLDTKDERLLAGQQPVPLKPKAFRLLKRMLECHGQLLTKQDLLQSVWTEVTVSDAVLKVCIAELRAALGDSSDQPKFIQTVHGRGYRFIAEVDIEGQHSPQLTFIGRSRELDLLDQALVDVRRGTSRLMLISGEPGMGKTSLLQAFLDRVNDGRTCWVAHGRCSALEGQREAYMPLLEGLGRIGRGSDARLFSDTVVRHAPAWASHLQGILSDEDIARTETRALGGTLGRMLREMGDLVETLSKSKPFVLALEDLHWSDQATLELIDYLARRRANARLLLIGTTRASGLGATHGYDSLGRAGLAQPVEWEELPLKPLKPRQITELLASRFGECSWARRVGLRLHEKTAGNPLFVVSMLQHLVRTRSIERAHQQWFWQENADTWHVPEQLRAFILHWFHGVPSGEQQLLQAASILERDFSAALLAEVLGADGAAVAIECQRCAGLGFLDHVKSTVADGNDAQACYRFAHPLFQQTLYEALDTDVRKTYHQRAVGWLRRARVRSALLARHHEHAGNHLDAMECHLMAAASADEKYAYLEAIAHLEKALALLQHVPEAQKNVLELRALLALGQPLVKVQGWASPEVERTYRRAYELCDGLGDGPRFAALAGLYKFFLARGQFETAVEIATECRRSAQALGSRALVMTSHAILGIAHYGTNEWSAARDALEASRALYSFEECQTLTRMFGDDPAVGCLGFLGRITFLEGDVELGCQLGHDAVSLARRTAHPHVVATALALCAHLEAWRDNDAAVEQLAAELSGLSVQQSFILWELIGRFFTAWVRARAGDARALDEVAEAHREFEAIGTVVDKPIYATLLAELYLRVEQPEAALKLVNHALEVPPRITAWDARLSAIQNACLCQLDQRSPPR